MLLSKCTIRGSKNLRFIKKQEVKRILTSFGLKTSLDKVSLLGALLF